MNIYLAANYERRLEIVEYAKQLREDGHIVTSRWLTGEGEHRSNEWCAEQDLRDLAQSECQINFTTGEPSRGGRQVEFGFGIALEHRLVLVGPREHVFHHIQGVEQYNTFEEARQVLKHALPPPQPNKLSKDDCLKLHGEDWQQARSGIVESTGMMNWCPTCKTYRP